MSLKLPEKLVASKSFKMSEFASNTFSLYDDEVPKQVRDAILSQSSPSPKILTVSLDDDASIELIVTKAAPRKASSDMLVAISDYEQNNEDDSWEMAKMCPNDCNCGKCPLSEDEDEDIMSHEISNLSLAPDLSSISLVENFNQSRSYLSIIHVIPLRNYGAIIRWNVVHQHGIRGYKVFMDGTQVSSVHSPSRMSAVIESANMKIPHHFAVSVTPNVNDERMSAILYHNMHAVYLYKPNNFIH